MYYIEIQDKIICKTTNGSVVNYHDKIYGSDGIKFYLNDSLAYDIIEIQFISELKEIYKTI